MKDDQFEWDDKKAASNYRKHRVSFEVARDACGDAGLWQDIDDNDDEERWKIIGASSIGLIVVVYTDRGDRKRIISARQASPREQDLYHRQEGADR